MKHLVVGSGGPGFAFTEEAIKVLLDGIGDG
jgi:hypothetical protein